MLGLTGDEGKGKATSKLASQRMLTTGELHYDYVARWAGGNNAGHTIYINGEKYKTHLVPAGVFHGITSVIGPNCVLHKESFLKEMRQLRDWGFDTSVVKVSPRTNIVKDSHIEFDKKNLADKLGTTAKGIAPCYSSKAARVGVLAKDVFPNSMLWDEKLDGNILCEGAQGVWLDINQGHYPYVTSSETLPYAACSLGFPPQCINDIWGVAKIYDTRSGEDPLFPSSLLDDPELLSLADLGSEYGVTTGRRRKVNWLNLDKLIHSVNMTGTTRLLINKCDIMSDLGIFKMYLNNELKTFESMSVMQDVIKSKIESEDNFVREIIFSYGPEDI